MTTATYPHRPAALDMLDGISFYDPDSHLNADGSPNIAQLREDYPTLGCGNDAIEIALIELFWNRREER